MDTEQFSRAVQAKKAVNEAALVLWNTRLEILVAAGRYGDVIDHLASPVEEGANNCDCNRPCAMPNIGDWVSNPVKAGQHR